MFTTETKQKGLWNCYSIKTASSLPCSNLNIVFGPVEGIWMGALDLLPSHVYRLWVKGALIFITSSAVGLAIKVYGAKLSVWGKDGGSVLPVYQGQAAFVITRVSFSAAWRHPTSEIDGHGHGKSDFLFCYIIIFKYILMILGALWMLLSENQGCLLVGWAPKTHSQHD